MQPNEYEQDDLLDIDDQVDLLYEDLEDIIPEPVTKQDFWQAKAFLQDLAFDQQNPILQQVYLDFARGYGIDLVDRED